MSVFGLEEKNKISSTILIEGITKILSTSGGLNATSKKHIIDFVDKFKLEITD